jgi:two-component system NtrC family sensor kinase
MQLIQGAAFLLVLFLTIVAISSRVTFLEQTHQLEAQAQMIAESVLAAAEAGQLTPAMVARAIARLPVPDDGVVVVFDVPTNAVAAARGEPRTVAALSAQSTAASLTQTDLDSVRRSYGSAWTSDRRCRVIVGLPQRMVADRVLPIYQRNAIGAGAWYLASIVGLFLLLGRWIRSVSHLESMATRVSEGDLRTPEPRAMATSELEHMQRTLSDMITRLRELQRQVVRQERLAAIGTLVSGVAHEINNPLQSILGSAQVMQALPDLPQAARADLTVIQQESARASGIIRNLTRFTRQQPVGPAPVQLREIVAWLSDLWRRRLEEQGIALELDDQANGVANAVATELQQVALNFLVNAEYAVLHSGRPEQRIVVRTRNAPAGFLRFEVEDTGVGVAPEDEAKLFQPFFTSKPVGEGTGLGLSVSYGIIHSHGGAIGYERGSLGGARFFFEIPTSDELL